MASILRIVNIFLLIIAAFLLIIIAFPNSTTGSFSFIINSEEPRCKYISADYEVNDIKDTNLCCFEIQKMLKCEKTQGDFDYVCYNLKEGNKYYINSKTYTYCLKEGYDIKKAA